MADITTRADKGSPLTNNEVDANFINLNADKLESSDLISTNILVTPHGTITSTNLQQALEQLADQKFVQVSTPTLNVENGDFWFNPDDETLYVYREVSTGVFDWVPIMIGNNSPDSDTIDAGSY